MKKTTKFSRILAAFCAVALLLTSVDLGSLAEVFATEESYTTNLSVAEFAGDNERTFTGQNLMLKPSNKSLDGVLIDGIYNFSRYCYVQIGSQDKYRLQMGVFNDETFLIRFLDAAGTEYNRVNLTQANIGAAYKDTDIRIKVGFEFTNPSEDGTTTDVTMTVWIGNYTHEIPVSAMPTDMFPRHMYVLAANGQVTLKAVPGQELVVPDYDYTKVGVETLTGEESAKYTAQAKPGNDKSIDGVKLAGLYNFTGNAVVYVGTTDWYGLRLELDGTNFKYWIAPNGSAYDRSITPEQAGVTAFAGNDIRIEVGIHTAQTNADGTVELAYHLRIGEYRTAFIISDVNATQFKLIQRLFVYPQTGSLTISKAPQDPTEYMTDEIGEYTILGVEDFTKQDTYTNAAGDAVTFTPSNTGTLDGVIVDGIYNFTGNPIVNIGSARYYGLQIDKGAGDDSIRFLHLDPKNTAQPFATVTSAMAGCDVTGEDVRITAQFKFLNEDTEKGTVDLQIQITVGSTYEVTKVKKGVEKAQLNRHMYVNPNGGTITIKAVEKYDELLTFEDFGITEDTTFTKADGQQRFFGGVGTLDGVAIEGTYHLTGQPILQFGLTNNIRVQIHMNAGSILVCQFVDKDGAGHQGVQLRIGDVPGCDWRYQDLRIRVGVKYYNVNGTTGDVAIKVNLGDSYVHEMYVENVADIDKMSKQISISYPATADEDTSVTFNVMQPTGVEVTPGDMGISNATYGSTIGVSETIDISEFTGVEEKEAAGADYFIRSTNSLAGITIDGIYNINRNSTIVFGATTWANPRFQIATNNNYQISWQFIDENGNAGIGYQLMDATAMGFDFLNTDLRMQVGFSGEANGDGTTKLTINLKFSTADGSYKTTIDAGNVSDAKLASFSQKIWIAQAVNTTVIMKSTAEMRAEAIDIAEFTGADEYTVASGETYSVTNSTNSLEGITVDGIYNLSGYPAIVFGSTAYNAPRLQIAIGGGSKLTWQFINEAGTAGIGGTSMDAATLGFTYLNTDMRIQAGFSGEANGDGTTKLTINLKFSTAAGSKEATIDAGNVTAAGMAKLTRSMFVDCKTNPGSVTIKSPVENQVLSSGKLENLNQYFNGTEMNMFGKVFSADVQFDGTDSEIRLGGTSEKDGFRFRRINGNSFGIRNTYGMSEVVIDAQEAGLESTNDKFNLKISMNKYANDTDGTENDVIYGIWINDYLYKQQYLYSYNDAANFGGNISIYCPSEVGKVQVSTLERDGLQNSAPYILEDFGLKENVYSVENVSSRTYTKELTNPVSVDSTISGKIALTGDASMTMYMISDYGAYIGGIKFYNENGVLTIQHVDDASEGKIKFSVADVKAGDTFTFSIEEETIDANGASDEDTRFGIRINGKLYESKRFYLLDYRYMPPTLSLTLNVGTGDAATSNVRVFDSVKVEAYDLNDTKNGYLVSGKGTISVNNELVDNGTVLSDMGDYIVRSSGDGSYVKKVVLYRAGDVNLNGKLDVIDLIKVLKAYEGEKAATKAARKAADVDNSKIVNKSDSTLLRKQIVGRDDAKKVAQLSYEDNVMPIVGFYAPSRGVDAHGNEYDLITDNIYSKIKELGVNLILMSNIDNANSLGNRSVNDSLVLAEKYGLGAYVLDPRYSTTLDAKVLAEYQKQFAEYESYKGTFVVDEPFTVAGGRDYVAGKMLAEYKDKLDMLNSYSNTIGYMNIGPMDDLSNKQGYYDHVAESLQPLHKLISWDYYVYDDIAGGQAYASVKGYFANMTYMRQQAKAENKPFWAFIQAGGGWERKDGYNGTTPSEAELLWNVNTSLAYGVKGIQYFPLVQPSGFAYASTLDKFFYNRNGLIGADGSETQFYSHAKKANNQIIEVDEYLLNATSLDVLAIGSAAQGHTGINKTSYGVLKSVTATDGALIGVFDYQGKTAYYVVNYDAYDADTNDVLSGGDAAADEITLNFESSQTYKVVSTQLATTVTNGTGTNCTLSLNNGGAALVLVD